MIHAIQYIITCIDTDGNDWQIVKQLGFDTDAERLMARWNAFADKPASVNQQMQSVSDIIKAEEKFPQQGRLKNIHSLAIRPVEQFDGATEFGEPAAATGKPSWGNAPEWAQWLAQDESGYWYWFGYRPEIEEVGYWAGGGPTMVTTEGTPNPSWRDTLEARP